MGQYFIEYSKRAAKDLKSLSTSGSSAIKKKLKTFWKNLKTTREKELVRLSA